MGGLMPKFVLDPSSDEWRALVAKMSEGTGLGLTEAQMARVHGFHAVGDTVQITFIADCKISELDRDALLVPLQGDQ